MKTSKIDRSSRARGAALSLGILGTLCAGCALDADPTGGQPIEGPTGTVTQELASWAAGTKATRTDLTGFDTGWPRTSSTCILSAVAGNLSEGGYFEVKDEPSIAGASWSTSATNWKLFGHGGAYTNQVNQRVFANNPVWASSVCIPHPESARATWESQDAQYGVAAPVRIASLAPTRRCFMTQLIGVGGTGWRSSAHFARVTDVTTTDATHPTTGWYVESNLPSNYRGERLFVSASCVDLPVIAGETFNTFGGATTVTNPITTSSAVKACGLREVRGAFDNNSFDNGVKINAPSTQGGTWTMTVSAGKRGAASCIR